MNTLIEQYIKELNQQWKTGKASEHTYRPALKTLIEGLMPDFTIVNEPKRFECGAPDYIIMRKAAPIAFFEAKDLNDGDLDGHGKNREQFTRYKSALDTIVFTDYLDFHLYEHGEAVQNVRIGEMLGNEIQAIGENEDKFLQMFNHVKLSSPQKISSASVLAQQMAGKARLLAKVIERILENETEDSQILQEFDAFKEVLIKELTQSSFADLYAQTIAYGMFSARLHDESGIEFTRLRAAELIPRTNPFLRKVFQTIAGFDLDERIAWIVDDLVQTFAASDLRKIMDRYEKNPLHTDPMIHFYEEFLAFYNPKLRKTAGVYYTPQPVVRFIVRAVDDLLKRDFGLSMGLADCSMVEKGGQQVDKVQILDPATGTGTFLAEVVRRVYSCYESNKGMWQGFVDDHLLPRLNGFELMMAPYTIAHLKLDMLLGRTGYKGQPNRRFNIYLTDSLEPGSGVAGTSYALYLSKEANAANYVKNEVPVMVMMGNPPYNGSSQNKGNWILQLLEAYKMEPGGGQKLGERNQKWINDDYVKFMRLAQEYIKKNGEGIMAFINPHGYLESPTFRGMRWQLLECYDEIYIVNLHGNTNLGEKAPDGGKDENVFDILQGVCINLFVKTGKKQSGEHAKVYYTDLYGLRKAKYEFLETHVLADINFVELHPQGDGFFMVPKNFELEEEYKSGFGINELCPKNSVGVVTTKDKFLVCDKTEEVKDHINDLIDMDEQQLRRKYNLLDTRDWSVERAKTDVGKQLDESKIIKYAYRPFDDKYLYYTGKTNGLVAWPRTEVQKEMLHENVGLVISRQCVSDWRYVLYVNNVCDVNLTASAGRLGAGYLFPLYVEYKSLSEDYKGKKEVIPNFSLDILQKIEERLGETVEPQELFDYIYAVLHTPSYRKRYKEFLKIDFPRIPYPQPATYHQLAAKGAELRKLHLMIDSDHWTLGVHYPEMGSNCIEDVRYDDSGKVFINGGQYFDGVNPDVWNFFIGGYQPAQKWLKDRKGMTLSFGEILHYQKIIYALEHTIETMAELDD